MSRVKLILKEFLFVPCLLFIIILMFSKSNYFESEIEAFNGVKIIFSSVLLLVLLESFLMFDLPNNLIFSRTITAIIMMISFFLLSYFVRDVKEIFWIISSIVFGTIVTYLFQRFIDFKKANLISAILLMAITISLVLLTFMKII